MEKNTIRVSDKYIRSLIREAIGNMPDMPVGTDDTDVETAVEDNEEPVDENGGQIRLSESQLREFVSYSVARLLRESGYLRAPDGDGSFELDFGPYELNGVEDIVNRVLAEKGLGEEWLEENDPFPVKVRISYGITPGPDDDQVLGLPGNTDDTRLTGWEIISPVDPSIRGFVEEVLGEYLKSGDFDLDGELVERGILRESADDADRAYEEDLDDEGLDPVLTGSHEKVGSLPDVPNRYEGMTWDEYVEAKKREREEDERKAEKGLDPVLTGGKGGSVGGFGSKDKTRLTGEDLDEMVRKVVEKVIKEGEEPGNEGMPADNFPKKASGTFTMRTRRGNVDKYKVFVEKTDNEELLTDIFIYEPMGKEWYPQAEYVVDIEEYTNGTWLPYWETFNGDVSIRSLANCFDKVVKLWKKVGYLHDEDDEIPFRYSGDYMKGAPKGMF